jgi:NAD(P)-dependent dehydrogenase (short-subunit alcohol dehydrogenase family)
LEKFEGFFSINSLYTKKQDKQVIYLTHSIDFQIMMEFERTHAETFQSFSTQMTKTIFITGGNRGLGLALVRYFAKYPSEADAWNVVTTARRVESFPADVLGAPNVTVYPLDLQNSTSLDDVVQLLVGKTTATTKLNVIIHNAGFNPKDVKEGDFFESTFYAKSFSARSVAECCYINALNPMELTGKLLAGNCLADDCIVLGISSWLGSITNKNFAGHYGYAGSKALFNLCLKGLSLEFQKDPDSKRCAIAINPGWMATDMGGPNAEQTPDQVAQELYKMIHDEGYLLRHNGCFLNIDRTEHPW